MTQYIHQLFGHPDHIVEVFDCYDGRYGNIFYRGQCIANFYKESYCDMLGKYSVIKELESLGADINTIQVAVYSLEGLREYQDNLTTMNFELAVDYDYPELLNAFQADHGTIVAAVGEATKDLPYYKFLEVAPLSEYL